MVSEELSYEEIGIIVEALSKVGIRKYKVTGGEPLIRGDIIDVVRVIKEYGRGDDISLTTNGYYLGKYISKLVDAGLMRVNISLHTLSPYKFKEITGVDGFYNVIEGIKEAVNYRLNKVKVNTVVLKGINEDELWGIIEFAEDLGIHVQFIELHPVGKGKEIFSDYFASLDNFLNELSRASSKVIVRGELHNRPIYVLPTGTTVEVVRPVLNPIFCAGCSRIRIAPDGALMPCLSLNIRVPVKGVIKSALSRDEKINKLIDLIIEVNNLRRPSNMWPINKVVDIEYLRLLNLGNFNRGFRIT